MVNIGWIIASYVWRSRANSFFSTEQTYKFNFLLDTNVQGPMIRSCWILSGYDLFFTSYKFRKARSQLMLLCSLFQNPCSANLEVAYLPCSSKVGAAMKQPDKYFLVARKLEPNYHNANEACSLQALS